VAAVDEFASRLFEEMDFANEVRPWVREGVRLRS
jgi:predicted unusual protein kinase regulating ubiquinone biosynthesis (AarF/ABC1/UbiB family)